MRTRRTLYLAGIVAAGCVVYLTAQQASSDVRIDNDESAAWSLALRGPRLGFG